jgi:nucleoside-diphosphate-sugar epimerase
MSVEPILGLARRRVLLTGATGFVGFHCIAPLLRRGFEVIATFNTSPPPPIDGVRWLSADLLSAGAAESVVREAKASHLLHLAWFVEPGKLISHPDNLAWSAASIDLLKRFHHGGGERCVMGGSCYEYDWRYGYCNEQLTPRQPDTLYGACKHGLAEILLGYCASAGLSGAWGRMFFLYGPRENPRRLVPAVIQSLLKGEPALSSHGQQVRDYAHVQDVADGLVALLDSPARGAYNIATGTETSVSDIARELAAAAGYTGDFAHAAVREGDIERSVLDPSKAAEVFQWSAGVPVSRGLPLTWRWFANLGSQ